MVKSFRLTIVLATILLAGALIMASATYSTAAKMASKKKPAAASNAKLIAQGKVLISQYRCNGCHGADLKGRAGRTPSILPSGALHDYSQAQFVTLLDSGKMNNGKQLSGMPTFHMKSADSKAIFAYLKSQK